MIRIVLGGIIVLATAPAAVEAQRWDVRTAPGTWVGAPAEEYVRLLQLTGVMPLSSLMIRPTEAAPLNWDAPDSAQWRAPWKRWYRNAEPDTASGSARVTAFHPYTQSTYNTGFPYGFNDGVMWAGRGLSVAQTVGARAEWGPVTLDVVPTYTWSQNKDFLMGTLYNAPANASPYADVLSSRTIDRPQRFGDAAVSRVDAGQTALTLAIGDARVGVGQRNLWWGPGTENALIFTNNAGGFPHAFAGTRRPVSVGIGRLEATWLVGTLAQSEYWRVAPDTFATKRWLNALSLVFEPRGAAGMYFGATRLFYADQRHNPMTLGEVLTMFQTFNKSALADSANPLANDYRDQMLSLSFRWVFPQAGFEAYGEWGRNDHSWDRRDMWLQPDLGRGVTVGAAKVFRLRDGPLVLRFESINLANTTTVMVRPTPVWYAHHLIQQGYTHRGQVIGAGIGPGSEQQTLNLDWFRPGQRAGFVIQRHRGDLDGFYRAGLRDPYRNPGSIILGPKGTLWLGGVQLEGRYLFQYELNRYAILHNDHRNHRFEVRGQIASRP